MPFSLAGHLVAPTLRYDPDNIERKNGLHDVLQAGRLGRLEGWECAAQESDLLGFATSCQTRAYGRGRVRGNWW
jgi:hypothetical protein